MGKIIMQKWNIHMRMWNMIHFGIWKFFYIASLEYSSTLEYFWPRIPSGSYEKLAKLLWFRAMILTESALLARPLTISSQLIKLGGAGHPRPRKFWPFPNVKLRGKNGK
jgi:hypothetical protein